MLNLLIVDDEPLAVRGVKSAIPWEKIGVSSIYEANHADKAKEIFAATKIDIMLCDIEMPQESGLELLSWVKNHYPETETVFLTCHADFSFAKQAIQLGSLDYLLKPIPPEDLEAAMNKVVDKIRREKEVMQQSRSWVRHHPLFMEHFWLDLVKLVIPANPTAVFKAMNERKIDFPESMSVMPVMIDVQRWHKPLSLRDEKILEYGLKNVAAEMIRQLEVDVHLITLERNELLAILILPDGVVLEKNAIKSMLEAYISSVYRYFYCDLSCYIGELGGLHELAEMTVRLYSLKKSNLAYNNRVFVCNEQPPLASSIPIPDMKIWSIKLLKGAKDEVYTEVKGYLDKVVMNLGMDASLMHQFSQDFMQMIYSVLQEKGIQAHKLFNDSRSVLIYERSSRSVTDLLEWIQYIMFRATDYIGEIEESNSVVDKVRRYICLHFSEDLSREHIANHFYLNPDYLDRLLKKETGMSMKEYLLQERIRIAQDFLDKTDMSVTDIATHIGIHNLSHFTKVFRNQTGYNPSRYRQRLKQ